LVMWECLLGVPSGSAFWECHVGVPCGSAMWECHVERASHANRRQVGPGVWRACGAFASTLAPVGARRIAEKVRLLQRL